MASQVKLIVRPALVEGYDSTDMARVGGYQTAESSRRRPPLRLTSAQAQT